jgi:hypothetical protein
MIWSTGTTEEGYARVWHCLGCGREILADPVEQEHDDRLKAQAMAAAAPWTGKLW